ncbi:MAG TPA: hypothetical protein PKD00_00445 [Burkholderiales bacterium]|nr:hypothetical protein [Burkholderiales bacterium]
MNVSYISTKAIIYQWLSETGRSSDFNEEVLATQILDALNIMEYKAALVHAVALIEVKNHRAKLPKGLKTIDITMYNAGQQKVNSAFIQEAIIPTFDGECEYKITRDCADDCGVIISHKPLIESLMYPFSQKFRAWNGVYKDVFKPMHYSRNSLGMKNYHLKECDTDVDTKAFYEVSKGYITTNFPEGQILIAYFSLNLDDDGFIFVPDDSRVITALIAYLEERQAYKEYSRTKSRDARMFYTDAKTIWQSKLGSARSALLLNQIDIHELTKILVNLYKFEHPEHFWKDYTQNYV